MEIKLASRYKRKAFIDLTALIDLIFLLVIFFMVTSSLGSESIISVTLPTAEQTGTYEKGQLTITIDKENSLYLNDEKIEKKDLLDTLRDFKKNKKDVTAVIRGDKTADYEMMVYVMDMLNRAGVPKFSLATSK